MKTFTMIFMAVFLTSMSAAQTRWDGGGGDGRWDNAANWQPDGVPEPGAQVQLDNSLLFFGYTVTLPSGAVTVELTSLHIVPIEGQSIELVLPKENTAAPGLRLTGAGESLILETGGLLRNASGASSGDAIQLTGDFRIANGARYLHQTPRGNAALIDRLSTGPGTELGIFEFDVPGTAGYTVSLTGNTFGSLVFSAAAAGGIKSYSGSGASVLQIRGHWVIRTGATLTSTLSANILLRGDLEVEGNLQLNPSTAGTTGRSIVFSGSPGRIRGKGNIGMNAQFRALEFLAGSEYHLDRNLSLPQAQQQAIVQPGARLHLDRNLITGAGGFLLGSDGTLVIGDPDGISLSGNTGNIQTGTRVFNTNAHYVYNGTGDQQTGNGLPGEISSLTVLKPSGKLRLSQSVSITGSLHLAEGIILSSDSDMLSLKDAVIESPANAYGHTAQGWERGFVDGPISWESSDAKAFVMPVGHGDIFAPVKIIRTGQGTVSYTVTYHPQSFDALTPVSPMLSHVSQLEHWSIISSTVGALSNARVALSWRPASGVGTTSLALADLRIAQYEDLGAGLRWEPLGVNPNISESSGYGWIESDLAGEKFSIFTLGSVSNLNILPLRQLHISGNITNGTAELRYRAEGSGEYPELILERSVDGRNFKAISPTIKGLAYGRDYQWSDSFPNTGWNHYRIQASHDGVKTSSSRVIRLWNGTFDSYRLFPNPATERFTLILPPAGSRITASLVHADGRVIRQITLAGTMHQEDISDLPPGRYFLMIKHLQDWRVISFLKY